MLFFIGTQDGVMSSKVSCMYARSEEGTIAALTFTI